MEYGVLNLVLVLGSFGKQSSKTLSDLLQSFFFFEKMKRVYSNICLCSLRVEGSSKLLNSSF